MHAEIVPNNCQCHKNKLKRIKCKKNIRFDIQGTILNLCMLRTPMGNIWQTVKTQMKCRKRRHFKLGYTVIAKTKTIFREINSILVGNLSYNEPSMFIVSYQVE